MTTDHAPVPHPPAPGVIPLQLPKSSAVDRLDESLRSSGVSERAAGAIAAAAVDPAALRRALPDPVRVHTASGDLHILYTRVWTPAVIPHPANLRFSTTRPVRFANRRGRSLPRPISAPGESAELLMRVDSPDQVTEALADATDLLAAENPLHVEIGLDGVIEPITLVAMTFEHDDASPDVTVLAAVDGSSRVAGAYSNLDVSPDKVVYSYAVNPSVLRGRIGRLLRLAAIEPGELDDDDIRQLNSLTLPAAVVVAFTPTRAADTAPNFARAIDARVGGIHIAPPTAWSKGAQLDVQLNAVLDALETEGDLPSTWAAFYAGDLTAQEAETKGLGSHPDQRAAHLLSDMHRPTFVRTIHEALRGVGVRTPSFKHRAAVAAEGALRAFRDEVGATAADSARNLYAHLFAMDELRGRSWELFDHPRTALAAALDNDPDAVASLLSLAIYWLGRHGVTRRSTRGGDPDRRDIADVVRMMVNDRRGLAQLHRIIEDGRAGGPIRRVSTTGKGFVKTPSGDHALVTEAWIRRTWGGGDDSDDSDESNPIADLQAAFATVKTIVADTVESVDALLTPAGDDGQPLVGQRGLPPQEIEDLLNKLNQRVTGPLAHYAFVARSRLGGSDSGET